MAAGRAMTVLIAALLVAMPAGALADKGSKGKGGNPQGPPPGVRVDDGGPGKGNKGAKGGAPQQGAVGILISSDDRRVIQDYFRINPYPVQDLPPGIAKNLARGKPLPPGIAKRNLPPGLVGHLPPRPGYEWVAVGRDVALVAIATGVVADILRDAF
jgi:Nickel/cobalt transporter regulator